MGNIKFRLLVIVITIMVTIFKFIFKLCFGQSEHRILDIEAQDTETINFNDLSDRIAQLSIENKQLVKSGKILEKRLDSFIKHQETLTRKLNNRVQEAFVRVDTDLNNLKHNNKLLFSGLDLTFQSINEIRHFKADRRDRLI